MGGLSDGDTSRGGRRYHDRRRHAAVSATAAGGGEVEGQAGRATGSASSGHPGFSLGGRGGGRGGRGYSRRYSQKREKHLESAIFYPFSSLITAIFV